MVDEKAIEPHVPVWDKTVRKDGPYCSRDCIWDAQANEYRCPQGKSRRARRRNFTKHRTGITKANAVLYRSSQRDCQNCPVKSRCCPNTPARKMARSIHESARDVARRIATTPDYRHSRCERKKVEVLLAHLKRILKKDRLRLRGLPGANDEFLLAAIAQNLRRMAKILGQPPPNQRIQCACMMQKPLQ